MGRRHTYGKSFRSDIELCAKNEQDELVAMVILVSLRSSRDV